MPNQADWGVDSDNLTAPPFLGPNDPGIVLGTDVPPCMAATYAAVFRFQPTGAGAGAGLNSNPQWFIGQRIFLAAGNNTIDFGWLIYDQVGAVCGYRVSWTWQGQNRLDGTGAIWDTLTMGGLNIASGLPAFFRSEQFVGDHSGAGNAPVYNYHINFGDPLASRTPDPRKTIYTVDQVAAPRGLRLALTGAPGVASGNALATPAAESAVFTAWTGTNTMPWWPTRVHKLTLNTSVENNLAAGTNWTRYTILIRSTLSGTVLGGFNFTALQNTHQPDNVTYVFYLKNATGALVTSGLGISVTKSFSSAGCTVTLDTANVTVEDVTDTATDLTNLAVQIA